MAAYQDETERAKTKKRSTRRVTKEFRIFIIGFFLSFTPFVTLVVLQSSINIQENIGTLAIGMGWSISILVSLFITPVAVRRIGSRWVFILGEISYLLYIAAHFYPKKWVMVTAGIVVGIGEALLWTAIPVYLWHFGYSHGQFGTKEFEAYARKYAGIFFASFQAAQVFGTSISLGILYGGKNESSVENEQLSEVLNSSSEVNSTYQTSNKFQYCGANDCLDPNVTKHNMERYTPKNAISLYILLSTFCIMCLGAAVFHIWCLPVANTKHRTKKSKQHGNLADNNRGTTEFEEMVSHDGKKHLSYWSTLRSTFRHIVSFKQLCLIPQTLYGGLLGAFVAAEASRSFLSCTLGVEKVGMVILPYALINGSVSYMAPKIIGKFGRTKVLTAIVILDLCNYALCLFWQPTVSTRHIVYVIYFAFAVSEAIWKNCNLDAYTCYFRHDQEISLTVWNMLFTIGLSTAFLWSPLFCVYSKLYIQIATVLTSVIGYYATEYLHRRDLRYGAAQHGS